MAKLLFLPGAGARADFWRPAGERVLPGRDRHFFSWPGLGDEPHLLGLRSADDLAAMVLKEMAEPVDLVAQSMGGLIAMKVALAAPDRVRRIVLTATSGGLPVRDLGGSDWQTTYRRAFPYAQTWITETREDLSARLREVVAATLLIWGDKDAISPLAVGRELEKILPNAKMSVIAGGDHDMALTHPDQVAKLITGHLL
jgi:pimeloyl-ACP methyl ester carboxylesterase